MGEAEGDTERAQRLRAPGSEGGVASTLPRGPQGPHSPVTLRAFPTGAEPTALTLLWNHGRPQSRLETTTELEAACCLLSDYSTPCSH